MKTLTLIRHTTPLIAPGICYGQLDVAVAESFIAEAAAVSEWMQPIQLIFTSPLQRAYRLAEYLAQQNGCEICSDPRLMEMHFGAWEGRAWSDIERKEIDEWSADVMHYTPPKGESAQQMMQRTQSMLQDVARLPQEHIAIVAHGGSIRAMLAQLSNTQLVQTLSWQIDYGAVIIIR